MTVSTENSFATTPEASKTTTQTETSGRLILIAVGWWILASVVSGLVGAAAALMKSFGFPNASLLDPISLTAMGVFSSGVLLVAVRNRSKIVGQGNRRAGVGDGPITRWRLLLVLVLLAASWAFFATALAFGLMPQLLRNWQDVSPWTVMAWAVATVVLAPLAEELFFRGWLWVGLRQHWRAFPTALVTCGFWSAIHFQSGLLHPFFLIPTAVILGFARHFCGIRAAVAVHATYNLVGLLGMLSLLWVPPTAA